MVTMQNSFQLVRELEELNGLRKVEIEKQLVAMLSGIWLKSEEKFKSIESGLPKNFEGPVEV
jgi:hypothetical protein